MRQSRLHSLVETITTVSIGYLIAVASQMVIFPWFGIAVSFTENLTIALYFTVISIARSYLVRRWFTQRTESMS